MSSQKYSIFDSSFVVILSKSFSWMVTPFDFAIFSNVFFALSVLPLLRSHLGDSGIKLKYISKDMHVQ